MKSKRLLVLSLIWLIFFPKPVWAAGTFATNGYMQLAPSEVRAVIVFDGQQETLFESLTFTHNPLLVWNFVWLLPVPNSPQVELVKDDLFLKLDGLTEKKFTKDNWWKKLVFFDIKEQSNLPSSTYSRPIDYTKFTVFSPQENDKLNSWLDELGYVLPQSSRQIISDYQSRNWYFVAVEVNALHIQMENQDVLSVFGAHTLPVKITFQTDKPIFPLKLMRSQPDLDSQSLPLTDTTDITASTSAINPGLLDRISGKPLNKYPSLPLDLMYLKADLFVITKTKITAPNFTTGYANWISDQTIEFKDIHNQTYFQLPKEARYLTRMYAFQPQLQLDDVVMTPAENSQRVNAAVSLKQEPWRLLIFILPLLVIGFVKERKYYFKMKNRLIIVVTIGAILLVSFLLIKKLNTTQKKSETIVILLMPDTFEPKTVVVKKGTTVIFKNADTLERWPASDPHPEHYIYPEFDPQQPIQPGKEWIFVFDKVGDWTYHDHLFGAIRGKIKIK